MSKKKDLIFAFVLLAAAVAAAVVCFVRLQKRLKELPQAPQGSEAA